jgi:hypothetical protein
MSWSMVGRVLGSSLWALALGLASAAGAAAQETSTGVIVGLVAKCVNNVEQPLAGASVSVDSSFAVITDSNGQFAFALAPGQYSISVTSSDGNASRPNVPVTAGELLDVGTIDVGAAAVTGCGPEPTALPTATPTPTAAPPSPTPTATPAPATATPTATATPSDESPDMSGTPDSGGTPDMSGTPGPAPNQPAPDDTQPAPDDSGGTT